ncbi:MAG TPA: lanthionine synthetase C family protein [Gaiellaceae bacterium]|nr:lanthionine synthetase C family protein [Gaiellaceae bacterium]
MDKVPVSAWRPLLAGAEAREALRLAHETGERLRDAQRLGQAIEAVSGHAAPTGYVYWEPAGLAQGHPGLAILFAGLGWEDAAHEQIELTVAVLRGGGPMRTGLHHGLAGIAFAARFVDGERYERLLGTLDGLVDRRVTAILTRLDERSGGCSEHEIDLISGLAGIGAYLLVRGDSESLRPLLERLVGLLAADTERPAWHTPQELLDDDSRASYPRGGMNCGLAHGLPGPLALLALASRAGVDVPGLEDSIRTGAEWLVEHASADEWGPDWPYSVPVGGAGDTRPARAAWCYGAPGISRALWLAGSALEDASLRRFAVEALEGVFERPRESLRMDGPAFCHGVAGVLQITSRMAADSGSERLRAAAERLCDELVDRFDPGSLLGYRSLDPDGLAFDVAGLLDGAAGIALVLAAAGSPTEPGWDRAFLLD